MYNHRVKTEKFRALEFWRRVPLWGSYALLAYMPFDYVVGNWIDKLTGWPQLWGTFIDLFTIFLVGISLILVLAIKPGKTKQESTRQNYWIIAAVAFGYLVLHLSWYFFGSQQGQGAAVAALVANNRAFWYLIIGFSAALLNARELPLRRIIKLVLIVSSVVALVGLGQYYYYLGHNGGFGPGQISASSTAVKSVRSTFSSPDLLGLYLLLPLTLLWVYLLDALKTGKKKAGQTVASLHLWFKEPWESFQSLPAGLLLFGGLFLLHGLALILTLSQPALLAAMVSIVLVTLLKSHKNVSKIATDNLTIIIALIIILIIALFSNTHLLNINQSLSFYHQIYSDVGALGLTLFLIGLYLAVRLLSAGKALGIVLIVGFWAYLFTAFSVPLWSSAPIAAQWFLLAALSTNSE